MVSHPSSTTAPLRSLSRAGREPGHPGRRRAKLGAEELRARAGGAIQLRVPARLPPCVSLRGREVDPKRRVRLTLKPRQARPWACWRAAASALRGRYRDSGQEAHQRVKTVELSENRTDLVAEVESRDGESMIAVGVGWHELELRRRCKALGGIRRSAVGAEP